MPDLSQFHLLRPWWLLALLPLAVLLVAIARRERAGFQAYGIAPHLLSHLVVAPPRRWRLRPAWLVAAALLLAIVALAGPTWRRELPPFVEDKAPLLIALDVSDTMDRTDVSPSRLERAKQKIRDLLEARAGARTGLIAYAGSAHLVMPLTDDRSVIEPFLEALAPALMPVQGKAPAAALALGADLLAGEAVAGTILLVADDLGGVDAAALRGAAGRNGVLMLALVAPGSGLPVDGVTVTADGADLHVLERRVESRYQAAQSDQFGTRWRDEGIWLVPAVALLGLAWFRRGTTVAWLVLLCLMQADPADAQPAEVPSRIVSLWLTPDQQGRLAFARGDYARAATLFADPMWRGIAAYRGYDFLAAAEAFRTVETIEGRFALGNAEAQNHAWEKAIKAYQDVLAQQPDHAAAKANLAIVRAAFDAAEAKRRQQEQDAAPPPDLSADETRVDEQQHGGKRVEVTPQDVATAGAAEAWMRQVQTRPADFLKRKFAVQAAAPAAAPARGRPP